MIGSTLSLCGALHSKLYAHLFPGDGLEAAAILLCSKVPGPRARLLAKEVVLIPHQACVRREREGLSWPGDYLEQAIDQGEPQRLALVLVHSHPGGRLRFSDVDDDSDSRVIPCVHAAYSASHGSAIMVSDGSMIARLYSANMGHVDVDLVSVIGDDIRLFWKSWEGCTKAKQCPIAFHPDMTLELGQLSCVVIGVSGIGSIVAEQVTRLGFGEVRLIDFDVIEKKNLNRILNSHLAHAEKQTPKVEAFSEAIKACRGDGVAHPLAVSISTREAVLSASQADVVFCCVDTLEGRQIADLMCSAFLLPLFDGGVAIPTRKTLDDQRAIADVCGRVDYVQPGASTLAQRGVYDSERLRQEQLRRVDPESFRHEVNIGYIKGVQVEAPSVITLNMRAASAMVNEFIARCYPFRLEPNRRYARTNFSLAACDEDYFSEASFEASPSLVLARGDEEPLLGIQAFGPAG